MPEHVSIEYSDWRKVSMQQKEDMYSLVKAMKNDGVYPTRGEMYIKTRTRKDESIVDDEAAHVVTSLKAIESDSTSTFGDLDDFTKDDYSKVKGPEKRGYVRLVRRMPTTKDKSDSSSNSQIIHQLQSAVNVMINIIHKHIPNANLSTVLSDMNIQAKVQAGHAIDLAAWSPARPHATYQANGAPEPAIQPYTVHMSCT
ncbi:hypothetical protein R6Q57_001971 [Mikania cordata]